MRAALGPSHEHSLQCAQNLATSLNVLGEHGRAAQQLEQVVAHRRDGWARGTRWC